MFAYFVVLRITVQQLFCSVYIWQILRAHKGFITRNFGSLNLSSKIYLHLNTRSILASRHQRKISLVPTFAMHNY